MIDDNYDLLEELGPTDSEREFAGIEHIAYADAEAILAAAWRKGFTPIEDLTVSQWADKYRVMTSQSSAERGNWRTERTPYLREIMDALSPQDPTERVIVMKGTQLGFTEAGNNWIGYTIHMNPGPMMMTLPTVELAKRHSKQKLAPMIASTEDLKTRIMPVRSRDAGNTIFTKEFPGGIIAIGGANSAPWFRSMSARNAFFDDIDGYRADVGGEGDPLVLGINRTDAFPNRKLYLVSTPTIEGLSRIAEEFENSDQRYYNLPCPKCNGTFKLKFKGGIVFKHENYKLVEEVKYRCPHCKKLIDEYWKTEMLGAGIWIPENKVQDYKGFHLSSLYSPIGWRSWEDIVKEFLYAKKKNDPEKYKTWVNTRLAETFKEDTEKLNPVKLSDRAESYGPEIPYGAGVLTVGVDVQKDRLEYEVVAWGMDYETWGIEYGQIYGDPEDPDVWNKLDKDVLLRRFSHVCGGTLPIASAFIDSGYKSSEVFRFTKPRQIRRVFACRGYNTQDKPIVAWRPSKNNESKAAQYFIGTIAGKDFIYGRAKLDLLEPDPEAEASELPIPMPGVMHFPSTYDEEYFNMLTAEEIRIRRNSRGVRIREYVQVGPNNEALDIRVYATAAFMKLNAKMKTILKDIGKPGDKKPDEDEPEKKKTTGRRRPGGGGFVTDF
jgi:phage terminase large subunit GpA-like protein